MGVDVGMYETTLIPFLFTALAHVERDSASTPFGRQRLVTDRRIQGIHSRTRRDRVVGFFIEPGSCGRPHLVGGCRLVFCGDVGRGVYYIITTRSWGFLGLRAGVEPALVGHRLTAVPEVDGRGHRLLC